MLDTQNRFDGTSEAPKPNIVIHESGVAMGKEAFDTGKHPEGAVSKTGIAVPAAKPSDIAGFEVADAPKVDVENVSA